MASRLLIGLALAAAAAGAAAGCGYRFTQRYVARSGAERVHVRAFENRSTEPELGAIVTSALRTELSRRGAQAGEGAADAIVGEVRATEPVPASTRSTTVGTTAVTTWRIGVEVHARLMQGGAPVAEHVVRRETAFLSGEDPRETEGRRALALRRLAGEVAQELLRAFER